MMKHWCILLFFFFPAIVNAQTNQIKIDNETRFFYMCKNLFDKKYYNSAEKYFKDYLFLYKHGKFEVDTIEYLYEIYYKKFQYDNCERMLKKLIKLTRGSSQEKYLYMLVKLYIRMGQKKEAMKYYNYLSIIYPESKYLSYLKAILAEK